MQSAVLVVGAGPVGLTAAANLAHFGVPVRIIDSRPAPTQLSKALVIWRRSLLTLDPLIPFEHWMHKGAKPVAGVNFADSGGVFASVDTDGHATTATASQPHSNGTARQHMMPAGLMVTQTQIEAGLEQLLQDKYSISVQRSTQLSSFSVDEASGHVRCMLSSTQPNSTDQQQQEEEEEVLASYLIGCDGARSTVRKGLGVPFNGYTDAEQRFLMVDCTYEVQPGINSHAPNSKAEEAPQPDRVLANASSAGLLLVIPVVDVPNGIRVVWAAGRDGPAQPTLDDFQSQLMQQTRLQIKLKDAVWQSEFNINERHVDNYVHCAGRVLLAGDAAHVHSPAGGQGMNTGIQDAANLAWKVALAAECDASSRFQLLQTYQEERHPVGADAVRFSGMVLRANTTRNPVLRLMRRLGLTMLAGLAPARQRIIATVAEDTVSYTSSSLAKPASAAAAAGCAGTAFPDASISIDGVMRPATDLLQGGLGSFGSLVLLTPPVGSAQGDGSQGRQGHDGAAAGSGSSSSSKASGWPTHWGHWPLHVASLARKGSGGGGGDGAADGGGGGAVDSWGLVSAAVGGADGVLVRPDGIMAAVGGPEDIAAWMRVHGFAAEK